MHRIQEQALWDLARASSAAGKIIEAHADDNDKICRVVIEMSDGLRNMQLRESILQLWMADGYIASASRDGKHLFIDGMIGKDAANFDLIGAVAHQIKTYTQRAMQRDAAADMSGEMAIIAQAMHGNESISKGF